MSLVNQPAGSVNLRFTRVIHISRHCIVTVVTYRYIDNKIVQQCITVPHSDSTFADITPFLVFVILPEAPHKWRFLASESKAIHRISRPVVRLCVYRWSSFFCRWRRHQLQLLNTYSTLSMRAWASFTPSSNARLLKLAKEFLHRHQHEFSNLWRHNIYNIIMIDNTAESEWRQIMNK